jgi:hypothetical protein
MKSRRPVLYPFLIAVYPVAALYAQNTSSTPWYDLLLPVAVVTGATALLWLLIWPVVREPVRAALLTLVALVVFDTIVLAPGWVDETLMQLSTIWVQRAVHVWRPLVMGSELALAAVVVYFIVRMKEPRAWTTGLNIFALILLAFPIVTTVRTLTKHHGQTTQPVDGAGVPPGAVSSAARVGRLPDVYYIILDGYARADVMLDHFGLDVEPFLKRLERKGFFIARRSTANYCQTPLSLSSSLNITYLNGLMPAEWEDTNPLSRWIGDGAVVRTFKGLGYRFVTFATSFAQTEHPEAEFYFSPYGYNSPFHHMLLDLTPLAPFAPVPRMLESYTVTRDQTLYVFDKVPQIARWGAPTFTFAHILSPHPPFVFGKNGEDVSPRESPYVLTDGDVFREWYGERADYVSGYRGQAAFLIERAVQMIEQILANSPQPPVIILQSDHGSGLGLSTKSLAHTDLRERMSILNAYYLPEKGGEALYQSISPVNSFRIIFNAYFGAGLDLLPDRSYYSTWDEPYNFIDVSDRVRLPSDQAPASACSPDPEEGTHHPPGSSAAAGTASPPIGETRPGPPT